MRRRALIPLPLALLLTLFGCGGPTVDEMAEMTVELRQRTAQIPGVVDVSKAEWKQQTAGVEVRLIVVVDPVEQETTDGVCAGIRDLLTEQADRESLRRRNAAIAVALADVHGNHVPRDLDCHLPLDTGKLS